MGNPEPSMTRTQACSDCGHCSNGPKTVADQSSARILAPISPPPANTDSPNCVLTLSMPEFHDWASALSDLHNRIIIYSRSPGTRSFQAMLPTLWKIGVSL